jgi:hypothetical protein
VKLFGDDKPWRVVKNQYGYGLVVRTTASEVVAKLKGRLLYQDSRATKLYKSSGGQSLVQPVSGRSVHAIMVGPLSLVNHSCDAPYGFKFPPVYFDPVTGLEVTDFTNIRKKDLVKEYPDFGMLKCNGEVEEPSAGEEIFVDYGGSLWFDCTCDKCVNSTSMALESSDSEGGNDEDFSVVSSSDDDTVFQSDEDIDTNFSSCSTIFEQLYFLIEEAWNSESPGLRSSSTVSGTYNHLRMETLGMVFSELQELKDFVLLGDDVFLDLGSGYGAAVMYFSNIWPNLRACGIEYFPERHAASLHILHSLIQSNIGFGSRVEFICGDFLKNNLDVLMEATFVYSYDFLFSNEMVDSLYSILAATSRMRYLLTFQPRRVVQILLWLLPGRLVYTFRNLRNEGGDIHEAYLYVFESFNTD